MSIHTYILTTQGYSLPVYDYPDEFPYGEYIQLILGSNSDLWTESPDYDTTLRYDLLNGNYFTINLKINGEHSAQGGITFYNSAGIALHTFSTYNNAVHGIYRDFAMALTWTTSGLSYLPISGTGLYHNNAIVSSPGIFPGAIGMIANGSLSYSTFDGFAEWVSGSSSDTPTPITYPFFLLEQVTKVSNVYGNIYPMFFIGTDTYRFASLSGNNITCLKVGDNFYFATLSADNSLFEAILPEDSVLYTRATYTGEDWTEYTIPASETLPDPLTIYYIEYSGITDIKEVPIYTSANLAQGMFDAYYFLLTGVDPYNKAGAIEHGGGGGTWDLIEDIVTPPSLSPLSSIVGFFNVWKIDKAHLVQLSAFMMGNSLESLWAKTFIDLVDCIISLSILPVSPNTAGNAEITIGGYASGVYSDYVTDQYFVVNCGNLTVPEFYGCYLDYAPYTEIEIYLPYIGTMKLDADTIVGKTINVNYHIDVLTGSCVAFISSDGTILYTFNGCCAQTVPITSEQYGNIAASILTLAGATAAVIGSGGAAGAVIAGGVAAAGSALNFSKQSVSKSGHIGGTAGLMAVQYPYLIITRPKVAWSENQNNFTGYPSFITSTIGSLTGYTEFEQAHLDGLTCTGDEKAELELLLKGGVIL